MGKIAFVFSGQGAQYPGMGKELYENKNVCKEVFDKAETVNPGLIKMCFEGTEADLAQTKNTQPCMFTMELAAAAALKAEGIVPDAVAGFSLGELAAFTYAGCVSFEEGLELVSARGELMQEDAQKVDSGMAAVVKLSSDVVDALCNKYPHVYPVNYNGPTQITVAGLKDELAEFSKDVKEAGGRALPLKVGGGFHSEFVKTASESFGEKLSDYDIKNTEITMYSDYTGRPYEGDYKELLTKQICNPVRWQTIVEDMIANGFDTFVEIGPGKTLCGLISKINSEVKVLHVEDMASLSEVVTEVK